MTTRAQQIEEAARFVLARIDSGWSHGAEKMLEADTLRAALALPAPVPVEVSEREREIAKRAGYVMWKDCGGEGPDEQFDDADADKIIAHVSRTHPRPAPVEVSDDFRATIGTDVFVADSAEDLVEMLTVRLGLATASPVIRCAKSIDGTTATASEVYINGRLFVAAPSERVSTPATGEALREWYRSTLEQLMCGLSVRRSDEDIDRVLARIGPPPSLLPDELLRAVALETWTAGRASLDGLRGDDRKAYGEQMVDRIIAAHAQALGVTPVLSAPRRGK